MQDTRHVRALTASERLASARFQVGMEGGGSGVATCTFGRSSSWVESGAQQELLSGHAHAPGCTELIYLTCCFFPALPYRMRRAPG